MIGSFSSGVFWGDGKTKKAAGRAAFFRGKRVLD
jgi:hypothetical protein